MVEHDETMSLSEAARRYGLATKTIRAWIQHGLLPAPVEVVRGQRQRSVRSSDVEHVMRQKGMQWTPSPPRPRQAEPVGAQTHTLTTPRTGDDLLGPMQARLDALEQQVRELATRLIILEEKQHRPQPAAVSAPRPRLASPSPAPSELPPGTLHLDAFAAELGLSGSGLDMALRRYAQREGHPFEHILVPFPNMPGTFRHYFTPEQQEVFRQWRAEHRQS